MCRGAPAGGLQRLPLPGGGTRGDPGSGGRRDVSGDSGGHGDHGLRRGGKDRYRGLSKTPTIHHFSL